MLSNVYVFYRDSKKSFDQGRSKRCKDLWSDVCMYPMHAALKTISYVNEAFLLVSAGIFSLIVGYIPRKNFVVGNLSIAILTECMKMNCCFVTLPASLKWSVLRDRLCVGILYRYR